MARREIIAVDFAAAEQTVRDLMGPQDRAFLARRDACDKDGTTTLVRTVSCRTHYDMTASSSFIKWAKANTEASMILVLICAYLREYCLTPAWKITDTEFVMDFTEDSALSTSYTVRCEVVEPAYV